MKTCKNTMFVLFVMLSLLAGCGGKGEEKKEIVFEKAEASPQRITEGEKSRVAWKVSGNAATLQLYKELGNVPVLERSDLPLPEGSIEITPQKNTTFRLQATGPDGKKDAWVSVEVTPRQQPPPDPGPGPVPPPPPIPQSTCSNSKDDDGDGKIDLNDPGCESASDTDETDLVLPPPQDPCVENPGVQVAFNTSLSNISGVDSVRVWGNRTYFTYTESNLEDTFSRLVFGVWTTGDPEPTLTEVASFSHGGIGGSVAHAYDVGSDGTVHLIWWRLSPQTVATFMKSVDGKVWSTGRVVPIGAGSPISIPKVKVSGSHVYLLDGDWPNDTKIYFSHSADGGNTWDQVKTIQETLTGSISLENMFVDTTGKLYVLFGESINNTSSREIYTELMVSADNGATWSAPIKQQIFDEAQPEITASIVSQSGTIYQWYRDTQGWTIRSGMDFQSWTEVGRPPFPYGNLFVGPYGFIIAQSVLCDDKVGLKIAKSSDGLAWSPPSWFQVLSIPNTDLGPNGGFVSPSFSVDVNSTGKLAVLRTRVIKNVDYNDPSEIFLKQDP